MAFASTSQPVLATRIRQNIRDHIESPQSPLVLKKEAVKEVLGYPVTLDPEWLMLWKTLQAFYPDNATFVPSIATVIINWCDAFMSWLESEENEDAVEKLLDALTHVNRLDLMIEVSGKSTRPVTAWDANKSIFVIALPKGKIPQESTVLAGFTSDLLRLFAPSPMLGATELDEPAGTSILAPEDAEDWADLDLGSPESHTVVPSRQKQAPPGAKDTGPDVIPELARIPRPEELTRSPPYWIVVKQEGRQRVVIQGSHAPSLASLDQYLKRWCRGDTGRSDRNEGWKDRPRISADDGLDPAAYCRDQIARIGFRTGTSPRHLNTGDRAIQRGIRNGGVGIHRKSSGIYSLAFQRLGRISVGIQENEGFYID